MKSFIKFFLIILFVAPLSLAIANNDIEGAVESSLAKYRLINSDNTVDSNLLELLRMYGYKSKNNSIEHLLLREYW